MGLFRKRKSRATRRAEARALKARAKLEARLAAKADARRFKATRRTDARVLKAQLKSQRRTDRTARKSAEAQLRAAREGKLLSPARIRRTLTVSRLLAPVAVPVAYRMAVAARGMFDGWRADRLGVPLALVGRFTGHDAALSARIGGAEKTLRLVRERNPKATETKQFVTAVTERLTDLSTALTAARSMPTAERRAAHAKIGTELDGIDADLMARLGLS